MKLIAAKLNHLIDQHLGSLQSIPEIDYLFKPGPGRWSKKEILGHLIDSAQNNIRRFIVGQYETEPWIVYNQDKWVLLSGYQDYPLPDLISLWYLLNKHICHLLALVTDEAAERQCQTEALHSIRWLAEDYQRHLLHHLHQILSLEPVAYP